MTQTKMCDFLEGNLYGYCAQMGKGLRYDDYDANNASEPYIEWRIDPISRSGYATPSDTYRATEEFLNGV